MVVFDKEWFIKHQKKILWLANSRLGEAIFQFKKMGHYINGQIIRITPNSVCELVSINGDSLEVKEHFFQRNEYAYKLYANLKPMWYSMHFVDYFTVDNFKLAPKLDFGFSTLTQYPGTIGTNNPDDGFVAFNSNVSGSPASFSTVRSNAGNQVSASSGSEIQYFAMGFVAHTVSNQWKEIMRAIYCFDTSSLTASASISATVLSVYGNLLTDGTSNTPDIDVYTATPASTSTLVATDYGNTGTTSQTGSATSYASLTGSGYNDFTLNSTGRGNVSLTGVTSFATRNASKDVANVAPGWVNGQLSYLRVYSAFNGSNKPKLVVTYTISVANSSFLMFMPQ